jgi:carbon monoxide dehydrogenase subunit G
LLLPQRGELPQASGRRKFTADAGRRMKIRQSFTVTRPVAAVWEYFQNVPAVAACLPGAELIESRDDGVQRGRVGVSLGPFKASFEGEATITADPATHSGHVEGRGVDKRGGSHSRISLEYRLSEQAGGTRVDIDVDLTLSGPIAQFGRTALVTETANVLIADFARNLEDRISVFSQTAENMAQRTNRISILAILLGAAWRRIKTLFGHLN